MHVCISIEMSLNAYTTTCCTRTCCSKSGGYCNLRGFCIFAHFAGHFLLKYKLLRFILIYTVSADFAVQTPQILLAISAKSADIISTEFAATKLVYAFWMNWYTPFGCVRQWYRALTWWGVNKFGYKIDWWVDWFIDLVVTKYIW